MKAVGDVLEVQLVAHMSDMSMRVLLSAKDGVDARLDLSKDGRSHDADLVRWLGVAGR